MKFGKIFKDLLSALFYVVIILYLTTMSPQLPVVVKNLYKNNIFRVVILFMILILANISPSMAIIVSIAFVVTMNNLQIDYFESEMQEVQKEEPKKEQKKEKSEKPLAPEEQESEETGCFEQRTIDMSKVLPSIENEGILYGSLLD